MALRRDEDGTTITKTGEQEEHVYDIVIVGGGASAMGLLRGLLLEQLPYLDDDPQQNKSEKTSLLRIALVERGVVNGHDDDNSTQKEQQKNLSVWYDLAHNPSSPYCEMMETVQQCNLGNRKIHVPTGQCLGGGTNINAGLVTSPIPTDPSAWPGIWKNGTKLQNASRALVEAMTLTTSSKKLSFTGGRPKAENLKIMEMSKSYKSIICHDFDDHCSGNAKTCANRETDGSSLPESKTPNNTEDAVEQTGQFPSNMMYIPLATRQQHKKQHRLQENRDDDDNDEKRNEDQQYDRVNYYDSLVKPLLEEYPLLLGNQIVTFYEGVQAECLIMKNTIEITSKPKSDNNNHQKQSCDESSKDTNHKFTGVLCSTKGQPYTSQRRTVGIDTTSDHRRIGDDGDKSLHLFTIHAKKEMILCCGAILSPALLLVSGIGKTKDLQKAGINPVGSYIETEHNEKAKCVPSFNDKNKDYDNNKNSIPVGHGLQDHILVPKVFLSPLPVRQRSLNSVQGIFNFDLDSSISDKSNMSNQGKDNTSRCDHNPHRRDRFHVQYFDGTAVPQILSALIPSQLQSLIMSPQVLLSYRSQLCSAADTSGHFGALFRWVAVARELLMKCIQIIIRVLVMYSPLTYIFVHHTVGFNLCLLTPQSKGRIRLTKKQKKRRLHRHRQSASTTCSGAIATTRDLLGDYDILVDPGYLTNPKDIEALQGAFESTENRFLASSFFPTIGNKGLWEVAPGYLFKNVIPRLMRLMFCSSKSCPNTTEDWFRRYIELFACPYFHWCSTCQMGEDEDTSSSINHNVGKSYVVDDRLIVKGFEGLRICDASVFPTCISGPTALACASLGYATAPIIAKEYGNKNW